MGEKEQGSGAGLFKRFRGAGKKGERGIVGAGLGPGGSNREREERGGGWGEMKLTGGPGLSAGERRERERGGGWAAAQEGEGARGGGFGPKGRNGENGGERNSFFFSFSQTNFQSISQMDF